MSEADLVEPYKARVGAGVTAAKDERRRTEGDGEVRSSRGIF